MRLDITFMPGESGMDKNKRICCFCERWESGGIESFLFNVLTRMDLQHLEIDIVASSIGRSIFTKFLQKNGIHFIELSGSQRNILENHRKFRKLLRERKYDILHLNAFQGLSLAYLCIAKQESVPVRIAHSHNSALRESPFRSLKLMIHTWARARYTKDATNLWTCSRMASEFMFNKCRGVTQRIEFIPNGIDTARFRFDLKARIKERVRLDFGNDLVIGSVGRFCYQKNQSFLIEIFNEVLKHRPDSRLLLVGEGESRDVLIDKVQHLGLEDKVLFYGTTDHVERLLWAMDIFVFPSKFEGLGIAVVEAQAAGLPVVCSDAIPEEAHITAHVHTASLLDGSSVWANRLLSTVGRFPLGADEVKQAGFDVSDVAKWLESFYLGVSNRG